MTFNYTLNQDDLLTYQLYNANRSVGLERRRKRARYLLTIIYLVFAGGLAMMEDELAVGFFLFAIFRFIVYPYWTRYRYRKHYEWFVKDQFKGYDNRNIELKIDDHFICTNDEGMESKVPVTEIIEISEIPASFLIKIKTAQSLIVPKRTIEGIDELRLKLQSLSQAHQIPYQNDLNWKWR